MFCPRCHDDFPEAWKVCPKDATPLLKSNHIGKYTIEAPLGAGGMGTVYRATNPDTKGEVAIKVMHPEAADSESNRSRFKREAAAIAKLKTSHVVKVYDFGAEADGTLYLVMELLDGHTLRDEIHPPPDTMAIERVQFLFDGVLKGLAAAHKSGIVHRDLKPENIFISTTDDGEVPQILDFGIARIETPEGVIRSGAITRPGTVMGTAVYMAPEQLQGLISQVGTFSDVYAIGAIMFEVLTGTTQVKPGSLAEVLIQVRSKQLPRLSTLRPDLPPALCDVIQSCLDTTAARRPQHADELRTKLGSVWGWVATSSIPPTAPRKNRAPSPVVAATQAPSAPTEHGNATEPASPQALGHAATVPERPAALAPAAVEATPVRAAAPAPSSRSGVLIFALVAIALVVTILVLALR